MKKEIIQHAGIKLVGLSVRTNNKNEMNPATGQIGKIMGRYWEEDIPNKILYRKNPGITLSVYTNYASDEHGDYTYFLGEEVSSFEQNIADLRSLIIPAGKFQKLTTKPGKMPGIVIDAWQQIWAMTPNDLGGKRLYQADFELYDERAADPTKAIVDIYVGIV